MANATILSWINAEVDHALKLVRDHLARLVATPEDEAPLKVCPEHLHQVSGALRMVGLAGATRFCEAIEASFSGLEVGAAAPASVGIIDRAVLALKEFVDDLSRGKANVPLRLLQAYRDLGSLQGKPDLPEKDLFYPDTGIAAPEHASPKALPEVEISLHLMAQRMRFQRGLLGMLRSHPGALDEMRQAIDALHQVAAQLPEPHSLWWVAQALVEVLADPAQAAPDAQWASQGKALCNKIDFQMRDLAAGKAKGGDLLLREVLYALARCKPVTPRIAEVKQLYQLDGLFPEPELPGGDEAEARRMRPAQNDLRSRLEALKSAWLKYISAEPKGAQRFRDLAGEFKAKAEEVGYAPLVTLLDAVSQAGAKLPDPYPRQKQLMIVEMASAFLLAESAIEVMGGTGEGIDGEMEIMGGWLLDAARGKPSEEPPAGLRASLVQQIGTLQLRAQVAKEILANLQHVEQALDAFARDPGKRDSLQALEPYLRQINGALVVLGFERAAEALAISEALVAVLAAADHPEASQDMDWIAEGLSSLGFFLEPCLRGREPAAESIELFFRRYERRGEPFTVDATVMIRAQPKPLPTAPAAAPPPSPSAPAPVPETPREAPKDAVLDKLAAALEEEAKESRAAAIKETAEDMQEAVTKEAALMDAALKEAGIDLDAIKLNFDLPVDPAAPEPSAEESPAHAETGGAPRPEVNQELLEIYLDEAGEVLGNIDGAVPLCREQGDHRDPLTTIRRGFHTLKGSGRMVGLMDLGEVAWEVEQVMNRWLEEQRAVSPALLRLIESASAAFAGWVVQLREGTLKGEIDARAVVDLARRLKSGEELDAAPAEPFAEPVAEPTQASSLFSLYVVEAASHIATLETQFRAWRESLAADTSHELMRAAHTLASSSHTAGFAPIGELAALIEQWVPLAKRTSLAYDADVVESAISRLGDMVAGASVGETPRPAEEAAGRLHELMARLQAEPVPALVEELAPEEPKVEEAAKIEEAPKPAPTGRELRRMHDDIDEQLLPIFLEEATELLPQIGSDMRDWKANPTDERISQSLQRGLHTLKGSARMAGAIRLGELTHIMESRIESAIAANVFPAELFVELEDKMDRLSIDLERMGAGPASASAAPVAEAAHAAAAPAAAPAPQARAADVPAAHAKPAEAPRPAAPRAEAPLPSPAAMLRINADTLDQLINESGEVSIARSRLEAELRAVKQSLIDLSEAITRLRTQLREVEVQADSQMQSRKSELEIQKGEFDPLEFDRYTRLQELTRGMAEGLHDVMSIQQALVKSLGESDAALLHQARINRDVQQELMRMRAVPFSNLNERLYRIVRQAARELEKKAELEIEGAQVELDRSVLERIGAPLEHMLRNSLAHGIEAPEARVAAGKPEAGKISISLRQESNEIALIVADDGTGLDLHKLHKKAIERGHFKPGREVTDAELMQLIFLSGVSTAESVTQLAGRGIGMDVVKSEITAIGGRVEIATTHGKGTTFTVYLPLTLAVTQVVMVRAGTNVIAVSAAMVEQVLRLKTDDMVKLYEKRAADVLDRRYPLHYLQNLLGVNAPAEILTYNSVLLLRSGIQRIAVHVDELIGNQEIVVKNIGPQLVRVPGIGGATVLADGRIVLIVNPVPLASRMRGTAANLSATTVLTATRVLSVTAPPVAAEGEEAHEVVVQVEPAVASHVVMVVDDSLTVRKITSRLLEREGYEVLTAKDGVDALEQMKDMLPGVMLVDIEMPRMDGFDLARNVRGDPRTAQIPIVIISSRTADKHRNQAAQLGVNAFLGKPYQETELLQHIATYIGEADTTGKHRLH